MALTRKFETVSLADFERMLHDDPLLINSHDEQGFTPLHYAAWNNRYDLATLLLSKGANVNALEKKNLATPLHWACSDGDYQMVELLLRAGAIVEVPDKWGATPLHWSFIRDDLQLPMVKLLVEAGADIYRIDNRHHSVIHAATRCIEIFEYFLELGADINFREDGNVTPLRAVLVGACNYHIEEDPMAARQRDNEVITFLLAHGADVNATDWLGQTPFHIVALDDSRVDQAHFLLKYGADVNTRDKQDQTPLHISADYGSTEITKILLAHHADPHLTDHEGRTPLHVASRGRYNSDIIVLLLDARADIHARDPEIRKAELRCIMPPCATVMTAPERLSGGEPASIPPTIRARRPSFWQSKPIMETTRISTETTQKSFLCFEMQAQHNEVGRVQNVPVSVALCAKRPARRIPFQSLSFQSRRVVCEGKDF